MKKSRSRVALAGLFFALTLTVNGQILKEGIAPSIQYSLEDPAKIHDFSPVFDWDALLREDEAAQKQGSPLRAGFAVNVGKGINDFGEWSRLPDGRMLWRVSLRAEGASGLGVVFDQFELPEGSELYLYNESRTMVNGALGSHNNNPAQVLSTQVLYGSTITIEYVERPSPQPQPEKRENGDSGLRINLTGLENYRSPAILHIGELMFMYRDMYSVFDGSKPSTGASDYCEVDINCSEGDNWQDQKRGVAHSLIKIDNGWWLCGGTLINNTLQNGSPLFLSAYHCGEGASEQDRTQWQFYFNYERPSCGSGTPPTTDVITGCELLAEAPLVGGSDLLLVRFFDEVPLSYNPYYNGWFNQNTAPTSGVVIHHPAGDVKKISTFTQAATSNTPVFQDGSMANNSAWRVAWAQTANGWGVVEGGSSGSPLFNQDGLVVGTLSGGSSSCANPTAGDVFGKLSYHWESNGSTADKQLKAWLDPIGSGATSLPGWDPAWVTEAPVANFSASATTVLAGTEIAFTDLSTNGPVEWLWDFGSETDAFPPTSTQRNPKVAWATPGTYTINLTASNAYGTDTETKTAYITVTSFAPPATNPVTIGTGTSTSGFPISSGNRYPQSIALYTASEIGAPNGGIIESLAWFAQTARGSRPLQIFIKHTNQENLTASTWQSFISGAEEVFNGTISNSANEWIEVTLQTPFTYDGVSNILVMGFVNSFTQNQSANIRYSNAPNKHQEWTGTWGGPSSGSGTVNGNRPNIQIRFKELNPPVANFAAYVPVLSEDFEGASFPPEGWSINNQDGGGQTWASSTGNNHTPGGSKSAFHNYGAFGYSETGWLITPLIELAAGQEYELNFWSLNIDPTYYGDNSVLISTTGTAPANFTEIWSPGSVTDSWVQTTVDLSSYAGQSVYVAFRYTGTYAHGWYLDDVEISGLSYSPITIYEGDPVNILDKSTNSPSLWEWTTPGATPVLQYSQNASLVYSTAGVYDVSLRAVNAAGSDTETKTGFVTVLGRAPIADFTAKGNLKTIDFKPFIPAGASVDFFDASKRVPTNWTWSFPGGSPNTSNLQNPSSSYYLPGEYDVSLTASNSHGTDTKTETSFVTVGGTENVTNLFASDVLVGYNVSSGQVPGHGEITDGSTYRFYEWGEFFQNQFEATIDAVRINVRTATGTGKNITITVWDGATGQPGTILGSKTIAITSLNANAYNEVTFDSPIAVSGPFFVGFVLTYDASHNYNTHQFSIFTASSRGQQNASLSTAYFKWGTSPAAASWAPLNQVFDLETSMCIEPRVTYGAPSTNFWVGLTSDDWETAGNWSMGVPAEDQDVTITDAPNDPLLATSAPATGNLTINQGAVLTIAPSGQLTVTGTFTNLAGLGGLLIASDATGTGSLIHNTGGVEATVQRYATGGWASWDAGWHIISSPVLNQPIADFTTTGPGNDYDFYGWDEVSNTWINYKENGTDPIQFSTWNGGTSFNPGQGYLISYENTQTKTFAGTLNVSSMDKTGLTQSGGVYSGWHLMGNPFASALQWNDGNWSLNNIASVAKIWHEGNMSYSDIGIGGTIPSAQGFMVQVTTPPGSLSIPAAARIHSSQDWYKEGGDLKIRLLAREHDNRSAQETNIVIIPETSEAFHSYYDSRFLWGYAPGFYSIKDGEMLSTHTLPALDEDLVIVLGFEKNEAASQFILTLEENIEGAELYLFDKKLEVEHPLGFDSPYAFTAQPGDDALRFELRFSPANTTGLEESLAEGFRIYSWNNTLYLEFSEEAGGRLLQVFDLGGRLVMSDRLDHGLNHTRTLNLEAGVYLVRVSSPGGVATQRVFVK